MLDAVPLAAALLAKMAPRNASLLVGHEAVASQEGRVQAIRVTGVAEVGVGVLPDVAAVPAETIAVMTVKEVVIALVRAKSRIERGAAVDAAAAAAVVVAPVV